ncbi:hypothetical protein [Streptomyces monashensis]|uniref:hypothetical protein n=1 Tax=Streptomyces monashensis TaxID=1678012 RepID=UPI000AFAD3CA|nr:hypothetical protein [Streptomyces monashensis]
MEDAGETVAELTPGGVAVHTNARHPGVLTASRKERARVRSEKGIRWGGRPLDTAA